MVRNVFWPDVHPKRRLHIHVFFGALDDTFPGTYMLELANEFSIYDLTKKWDCSCFRVSISYFEVSYSSAALEQEVVHAALKRVHGMRGDGRPYASSG